MKIRTGSDFSGIGALDRAFEKLGIEQEKVFACDMDKYARKTYIDNYGEPSYYPENVYDREIPEKPLDLYMTSPPCQAFSLAGKRKGESDERGILFYNSHEFIKKNNPRYFIFENVKGLLSDAKGRTFQIWLDMLGGKSVNGNPVIFPHENSVPYHIYYKVLNAKDFNIPQNRERIFIVGIRDDVDNVFRWPVECKLQKRLKDVLEINVDEKYFLSEKAVNRMINHDRSIGFTDPYKKQVANTLISGYHKMPSDGEYIETCIPVSTPARTKKQQNGRRFKNNGDPMFTITTQDQHGVMIADVLKSNNIIQATNLQGDEVNRTIRSSGHGSFTDKHNFDAVVLQLNNSKESNGKQPYKQNRLYDANGIAPVQDTECGRPKYLIQYVIRRLTPRECLRLMDFPDSHKITVSDTQAYKQAGNSICVGVLAAIINRLKF